ncbi:DegT/DnrJ/EryC1/StrS family aminotransferase [Sphaerisporangium fuscum]|uniref:DegT/DnrJ/EryC1/StrS family aminotransferase n=1 Tax=Sphaerisporangium fuscum TaxID=2835868 RepID=UPI001BDD366B|nr:DegT/DnrJ/EryC1/StrS family aminotransferase [Sphaerisporangium fuscum]
MTELLAKADIEAAVRVLRSGQLGGPDHPEVRRFESALAQQSGVPHAVAVGSGTAAIHCALIALGIGPGDEVIVPAHTFIATATPVLMTGATPVVVDIDDSTYCIDPPAVHSAVSSRTRAIIAVHINGHPALVDQLPQDVPLISDACQAHGARLFGQHVGAMGVASAFSFWQDKLITAAGEGGAVLTSDDSIADRIRLIRSHAMEQIPSSPDFHHVTLGYNYRLTGVQAAVGHSQLSRLEDSVRERRARALRLAELLTEVPGIKPPIEREGAQHAFWKFVVEVEAERFEGGRAGLMMALAEFGVRTAPRYPVPLTRQPVLGGGNARLMSCPRAESLADRLLTIPLPAEAGTIDGLADLVKKAADAQRR